MDTCKRCHWSMDPPKTYGEKAISNKYVLSFLRRWIIYGSNRNPLKS